MTSTYNPAVPNPFFSDFGLALGRILVAVIYVFSGFGKFADLAGTTAYIASAGLPSPNILAIAAATVELVGGVLIVVGFQTRLVALGLFVFTAIATYYFHNFWILPEGGERMGQMIHALKNLSILGAFLMLAGVGAGRWSIDGRRSLG